MEGTVVLILHIFSPNGNALNEVTCCRSFEFPLFQLDFKVFFSEAKLFFLNFQFLLGTVSHNLPFTIHRAFLGQGGTAAQWPHVSKLVECVIILLVELHPAGLRQSRGHRVDCWGQVMRGCARIRRLVIFSKELMDNTMIQVFDVNCHTLTQW